MNYAAILRAQGYEPYNEDAGEGNFLLQDDGQGVYISYWNHPTDPKPTIKELEAKELDGEKYHRKHRLRIATSKEVLSKLSDPDLSSDQASVDADNIKSECRNKEQAIDAAKTKEELDAIKDPDWVDMARLHRKIILGKEKLRGKLRFY